jgi:alpha-L-fucosidase 2
MKSEQPVEFGLIDLHAPPRRTPTTGMPDGPLLGNGDLAAVVAGPAERLRWHLGKNDFWCRDRLRARGSPMPLAVGGLELEVPALAGGSYRLMQEPATAHVHGAFQTTETDLEMDSWIARDEGLLVVDLANQGSRHLELTARLWAGDSQPGLEDQAGPILFGHAECWLTPKVDAFCGELGEVIVIPRALNDREVAELTAGGTPPADALVWRGPGTGRQAWPKQEGRGLTVLVRLRPEADPSVRDAKRAAQPHGWSFNKFADTQFLIHRPNAFSLMMLDGRPHWRVGRLHRLARQPLPAGAWSWLAAVADGRDLRLLKDGVSMESAALHTAESGVDGGLCWFEREADPGAASGRRVAVALRALNGEGHVMPDGIRLCLAPGARARLAVAVRSDLDRADCRSSVLTRGRNLDSVEVDAVRLRHQTWWRAFWEKSAVETGEAAIQRCYHAALYHLACCCAPGKVAPGLFGNFITTDCPDWAGDYHLNYNYQAPWWGLFPSNHVDLAEAYDPPLLDFRDAGRAEAHALGARGILYPVGIGPWGLTVAPITWGQKSNAVYALANMIMRWQATLDPDYLRGTVWPFADEVLVFWESWLREENGRWIIPDDAAGEGTDGDVNPIASLGLVRMAFDFALEVAGRVAAPVERVARWRDLRVRLSDFPRQERQGKTVFTYAERGTKWGEACANTIQLQHVFPAGCLGRGSDPELLAIGRETVRQLGVWEDYNAFPTFYVQAARVGFDPEIVLGKLLEQCMGKHVLANGNLSYGGGGIETCGGMVASVCEMLLQSHEGVIRFFPCWPAARDASFTNLRARGAFLVSARRTGGRVSEVFILSERGGTCRLAMPWGGATVTLSEEGGVTRSVPVRKGELEFACRVGGHYQIRPVDNQDGLENTTRSTL